MGEMKWLLVVLGLIVGLVLLVVIVGALLPRQHHVTRSARYNQPPAAIWQAITDYKNFPSWRSGLVRVDTLPSKNNFDAWRESYTHDMTIPMQVDAADAPKHLVTRIADPNLPFGGTWTTEIASDGNGCIVRITEDGEVSNPFFRFVSRFIMGYTATIDTYLRDLGKKFGETPAIER
jgi:uncharacterized protein YndB with AHSA1/START domain